MKIIFISFLLILITWAAVPLFWKTIGGSFIHGNTVIYKGKQLFEPNENCSIAVKGENFEEIRQVCLSNENKAVTRIWINGVKINKDYQIKR